MYSTLKACFLKVTGAVASTKTELASTSKVVGTKGSSFRVYHLKSPNAFQTSRLYVQNCLLTNTFEDIMTVLRLLSKHKFEQQCSSKLNKTAISDDPYCECEV